MRDLEASARHLLDSFYYLSLATVDDDGTPRVSPLYFTHHRYSDLYWVSSPAARHSLNIARDPRTMAVVFDSRVPVGEAEAVYLTGPAEIVPDDELADRCPVAFDGRGGATVLTPDDLRGDAMLRLYVLVAHTSEVLVRGSHPTLGTGRDRRIEISLG